MNVCCRAPSSHCAEQRVHTRGFQVELSAVDALLVPVHAALLAGSAPIPAPEVPNPITVDIVRGDADLALMIYPLAGGPLQNTRRKSRS